MSAILALIATTAGAQLAPANLVLASNPAFLDAIVEAHGFHEPKHAFTLEQFSELVYGGRLDSILAELRQRPKTKRGFSKKDRLRAITLIIRQDGSTAWYALEPGRRGIQWQLEEIPTGSFVMKCSHIITRGQA